MGYVSTAWTCEDGDYILTHHHWASIWACEHTAYCSVHPGQHQIFAIQTKGALAIETTSSVCPIVHQPHWADESSSHYKEFVYVSQERVRRIRWWQCKWALRWAVGPSRAPLQTVEVGVPSVQQNKENARCPE